MAEQEKSTVTIDGKEFDAAMLGDGEKKLIANIQFIDQELNRLRVTSAAFQTARQSYVVTLKNALETASAGDASNS